MLRPGRSAFRLRTATRSRTRRSHLSISAMTAVRAGSRRKRFEGSQERPASRSHDAIPIWSWALPAVAGLLLALNFLALIPAAGLVLALAGLLLAGSVFAAVHHAEVLALKLGEPFGSILLAIAVTVIEVALIASIMLSDSAGSAAVARDTVFSAVMIVLNGIIGLCLVVGAQRHHEQSFQLHGASAALAVLGTLATICLILPNYTLSASGPLYSPVQLIFVGAVSFVLYCIFLFVQTIRHRDYFLENDDDAGNDEPGAGGATLNRPSHRTSAISAVLLIVSLTAVVLLAKI